MSNISIYYSKINLDSSIAALIMFKTLKHFNDEIIDLINYDRTKPIKINNNQEVIWIIGADISPLSMDSIIDKNPNATIMIANYHDSEKYSETIKSKIAHDLTKESIEKSEDHIPNSMADVMFRYLNLHIPNNKFESIFLNIDRMKFVVFLDAVVKYSNFLLMTQEETLLVYKNIDGVCSALEDNEPFWLATVNKQQDEKEYAKYIKSLRVVIDRNFSLRYLTNETRWLNTPILSASSEDAFAIMRLISYSYDNVVTYEDNSTSRIYRCHSKNNKEWFIKTIKPNDIWIEGNLLFLKTEIPSIQGH